jgi:hypothetical protein
MARGHFNPDINPRLLKLIEGLKYDKYKVNPISGYRPGDKRQHGRGQAIDIQLEDPTTGATLNNYQDPTTFKAYQEYANAIYQDALKNDPELAKQLRWGGYFSGGKGKYGAMDLMHFDTAGDIGMAGGSWEGGLSPEQAKIWGLDAGGGVQQVAAQMQQAGYSTEQILGALASIESAGSGDYAAVGKEADPAGHRARGKYQVMDYNIEPWAEQYLGKKGVTVDQFMADPKLQDELAGAVMTDYRKQYGDRGAFSKWYTGSEKEPDRTDVNGRLTGKTYTDTAMEYLGRTAGTPQATAATNYNSPSETGGARFGGTGLGTPTAEKKEYKPTDYGKFMKDFTAGLGDFGGGGAGGPAATGISDLPRAVLASGEPTSFASPGMMTNEDPRQKLALAMQRLNSGKLWV